METAKSRILQVLYGTLPASELSQKEIDIATTNLPNENTIGTHGIGKVDFTGFKFDHNTKDSNASVGLTKKDILNIDHKIQTAAVEAEEKGHGSGDGVSRSRVVELLLPHLNMAEVIWLIDSGVLFIQERKKMEMLKNLIGGIGPGMMGPPSREED